MAQLRSGECPLVGRLGHRIGSLRSECCRWCQQESFSATTKLPSHRPETNVPTPKHPSSVTARLAELGLARAAPAQPQQAAKAVPAQPKITKYATRTVAEAAAVAPGHTPAQVTKAKAQPLLSSWLGVPEPPPASLPIEQRRPKQPSGEIECPSCGRRDFRSAQGLSQHLRVCDPMMQAAMRRPNYDEVNYRAVCIEGDEQAESVFHVLFDCHKLTGIRPASMTIPSREKAKTTVRTVMFRKDIVTMLRAALEQLASVASASPKPVDEGPLDTARERPFRPLPWPVTTRDQSHDDDDDEDDEPLFVVLERRRIERQIPRSARDLPADFAPDDDESVVVAIARALRM